MLNYTTQSLRAPRAGLSIRENDTVLVVSKSGDTAFSFLEYAARVIAVTENYDQMQQRKELIQSGNYTKFMKAQGHNKLLSRRNQYFRKDNRLDNIKDNIENLEILEGDILDAILNTNFNKIFLSDMPIPAPYEFFDTIEYIMSHDGLIYHSHRNQIKQREMPENVVEQEFLTMVAGRISSAEDFSANPIVWHIINQNP